MKAALLVLIAVPMLFLTGCKDDVDASALYANHNAQPGSGLDYSACITPPSGATEVNCPGAAGTYNWWDIQADSSGNTIISNTLTCGVNVADVPTSQAMFDQFFVPVGYTSGASFESSANCASGYSVQNVSPNEINLRIWQKQ